MNEKHTIGVENIRWDLSVMYTGLTDPKLDADIAMFEVKAKRFSKSYKGALAVKLGDAIVDYAEIDMLSNKTMAYLFLRQSTDVADADIKAKVAAVQQRFAAASGEYLTFFELELVSLTDAVLEGLYASDATVARHKPWIEHLRVFKPHLLSEPVESALTKRSPFGAGTWSEFFDEVEDGLAFTFRGATKTLSELLNILSESKDALERAEALKTINDGLRGYFAKYSAQTLYVTAAAKSVEDRERGYKNPMDARGKSNRIPDAVVDALHTVVMAVGGPLTRRYYKLKAKHLGVSVLKWSDRNAPMPFADTTLVSFEEAKKIVAAAYQSFSPTLADVVDTFFAERRIDAPSMKGKQSGAFNYSLVLPDGKPVSFTLLNYLGSNRDVMTLAHELGHGVHGILAGKEQGTLMFHAPMAYCETASVFGEMTAFTFLKAQLVAAGDQKSLLALIMGKIDDLINTVIRQISFSNFERRLHGMDASYANWSEAKKPSVEELCRTWLEVTREIYGAEGEVFTYENMDHMWAYVGHFHRPFYVYSYAFGELLTQSLYAARPTLNERFEPLYLDMLRSGATRDVIGLLAPFGLDARDPNFWANGLAVSLGALIDEAERLSSGMGV